MKKLLHLLTAAAICSLLTAPALASVPPGENAFPENTEVRTEDDGLSETAGTVAEEGEFSEVIIIEEEEVPLSALPISSMSESAGAWNAHTLTLAGVALMSISAAGMAVLTYRRMRESA